MSDARSVIVTISAGEPQPSEEFCSTCLVSALEIPLYQVGDSGVVTLGSVFVCDRCQSGWSRHANKDTP